MVRRYRPTHLPAAVLLEGARPRRPRALMSLATHLPAAVLLEGARPRRPRALIDAAHQLPDIASDPAAGRPAAPLLPPQSQSHERWFASFAPKRPFASDRNERGRVHAARARPGERVQPLRENVAFARK